jgi:uncharacterized protein YutE (UPF0331/DUF86 family)
MNERIQELIAASYDEVPHERDWDATTSVFNKEKFAELIVQECASICEEMATKCAGLPGDGALAKDCANYIRQDFGVE